MKSHILGLIFLGLAGTATAQVSIDRVRTNPTRVNFTDSVRQQNIDQQAYSEARYRAERARIRKERNYLEISTSLQGTLTNHSDTWIKTSGGDNSIAAVGTFHLKHNFSKEKFSIETEAHVAFGYNRIRVETTTQDPEGNDVTNSRGVWFKNQDEFWIQVRPRFSFAKNWSYGPDLKFRSQIASGYKSRTEQKEEHLRSRFMSPGYFDISGSVTYSSPLQRFPIRITFSPLTMSAVFVENETIRHNVLDNGRPGWQLYGLFDEDRTSKYEGGSSFQLDFDRTFGKKGIFRYQTSFYSFYGWITRLGQKNKVKSYTRYLEEYAAWDAQPDKDINDRPSLPIHPTLNWRNTVEIRATRLLSTTLSFEMQYDRSQNIDVRTKTFLSVGLTYTFRNK